MPREFDEWPYGLYESRNSVVFFNRRYEPIVRLEYPEHPVFDGSQNGAGSLHIGAPTVTPVDRKTRVIFSGQRWFYSDANPPRRNRQTRARIEALIDQIPELLEEIKRRESAVFA
ncbi:hypothetical protein ABIG06_006884 [Bradyrhizobium sp. USDA 326]|uniref:hypothetical protein n=1 Tax=Bradyrhizobium sp. USDA 326 TaxID=3377726 RepID=UPI003C78B38F